VGGVCDRDYYGNKRLELAGGLLALLFEDLFKRMNSDLRKQATKALSKQTRSTEHFDWVKHIDRSIITEGFEHAVASGNWTIKRFRMDRKGTTQVRGRLPLPLKCAGSFCRSDTAGSPLASSPPKCFAWSSTFLSTPCSQRTRGFCPRGSINTATGPPTMERCGVAYRSCRDCPLWRRWA